MMNILSQLVKLNSTKTTNLQGAQNLSRDGNQQSMGKKFARIMMNFIGLSPNDKSGNLLKGNASGKQTESGKQTQLTGLPATQNQKEQPQTGFFIGAHFLPMKQVQNGKVQTGDAKGESSGKNLQAKSSGQGATTGTILGKSLESLPQAGGKTVKNSGESSGKAQVKSQSKGSSVLGMVAENAVDKKGQTTNLKSQNANGKGNAANAETAKSESSNKVSGESAKLKTNGKSGRAQQVSKNFPGASLSVENKMPGKVSGEQMVSKEAQGNPMNNIRQTLADAVDGKMKNSGQKGTSQPNNITGQQKTASQQTAANQKHPALRHLSDQAEENAKKVKAKMAKQQASENAAKNTQQAASGKSTFSNVAQSFAAAQSDKLLFKPLQQNSSVFELDPSKLMKMQSSSSGDVEMELQAQADKDASAKDDGRASIKFNGPTISQLNQSSGRREFSVQLVRHLQQQSGSGKSSSAKAWNHHRFVMDDGQSLNVSVRHAEGAMQLQLSAGNSELNKIIQQHIDEIRQHLQEQMNVEIDLQLQNFGDPQTDGKSDGLQQSRETDNGLNLSREAASEDEKATSKTRSARYLGFNNNEWTA